MYIRPVPYDMMRDRYVDGHDVAKLKERRMEHHSLGEHLEA